jgi:lipopolysaccharide cholinephosphotransferase
MLVFPEEYWKAEVRNDFKISETMKRAWAVQMTVLDRVLEISKKHGLRVFMDYGSLLGTIRHGGYIPWDDDIDLCVLRSDYMKLIYILQDELPDYCEVYSFYTTEDYNEGPKAFVTNRKVIDLGIDPREAEITRNYYGCPYMTGIDLYPLDYVPQDFSQMDTISNLYSAAYDLAFCFDKYRASGELEEYLSQLEKVVGTKVKRDEHIRNNIWKLADQIAMMTQRRESRHVLWYSDFVACKRDVRRKLTSYSETIYKPFEIMEVPVPSGYEDILKVRFGENYMTPQHQKGAHEYPFFAPQERKILAYRYGLKLQEIY